MINQIKKILDDRKDIDGYHLRSEDIKSKELFFIKKNLDMNRGKHVTYYYVKVFRQFSEDGKTYMGDAEVKFSNAMTIQEMTESIERIINGALLVKNQPYKLVEGTEATKNQVIDHTDGLEIQDKMKGIIKSIYKNDIYSEGGINSCEIFYNKVITRFISSTGIDVTEKSDDIYIEIIVDWNGKNESVELYEELKFSKIDENELAERVKRFIQNAKDRSDAIDLSKVEIEKPVVILRGGNVAEFLSYYITQSDAESVYRQYSKMKINDRVKEQASRNDQINLTLLPNLQNSTKTKFIDEDGVMLTEQVIIENDELKKYHGKSRYAQYCKMAIEGNNKNYVFSGGASSLSEIKKPPYLEIENFSDFQMNPVTGDFAGEIRLGYYHDGEKIVSITGGSIGGNIKNIEKNLLLSKEVEQNDNIVYPVGILLTDVSISN